VMMTTVLRRNVWNFLPIVGSVRDTCVRGAAEGRDPTSSSSSYNFQPSLWTEGLHSAFLIPISR
jgi:hypothetical protein